MSNREGAAMSDYKWNVVRLGKHTRAGHCPKLHLWIVVLFDWMVTP